MKKSRFTLACVAFTTTCAVFTGCSDDILNGSGETLKTDEVRYMKVAIVSPDKATRATDSDFEEATDEEKAVNNIYMDFYDATGVFVKRVTQANISPEDSSPASGNVGLTTAIVQIDLEKGQSLPKYVMCYINTTASTDMPPAMTDLRETPVTDYRNTKGFVMSNSVYFGDDPVSGGTDVKISGTPINEADLHKTEADAAASTTDYVDIYVERYAAKVKFTADTSTATGAFPLDETNAAGIYPFAFNIDDTNLGSLIFTPEAWAINAESKSMYVVKNFSNTSPDSNAPTMAEITDYLQPWGDKWNDESNHRSYWSCSPSFYATQFPVVSDDITDIASGTDSPYMLEYHTYNDLFGTGGCGNISFSSDDNNKPHLYSLENTVGLEVTTLTNPKAASPSVVMVGNYQIKYGSEETNLISPNTTFYYFNNRVFFDSTPSYAAGSTVEGAKLMINEFLKYQQILYVKNNDNTYSLLTSGNAGGMLQVMHPIKAVRATNKLPMRAVTLQLVSAPTGDNLLYIKSSTGTGYDQVSAGNLTSVNQSLLNTLGVADCYKEGKGFFSIPIQHLAMTESDWSNQAADGNTYPNPISETGTIDWTKVRPGDFGLVRNHVYDLSVQAIRGRATAISDLDAPIVPQPEVDSYWIKYRINVLNWRIVPPQGQIIL